MMTSGELYEYRALRKAHLRKGRKAVQNDERYELLAVKFCDALDLLDEEDCAIAERYFRQAESLIALASFLHYSEASAKRRIASVVAQVAQLEKAP